MTIQLAELLQFLHILGEGDSKQTTVVKDHPSSTQVSVVAWANIYLTVRNEHLGEHTGIFLMKH